MGFRRRRFSMKKIILITLVLTISALLTLGAVQVTLVHYTPNVGWNTWVPQYLDLASTPSVDAVCWSRIAPQPNVGWNT